MNAELPQSYFELAASRRDDLDRSLATERAVAAERRALGRGQRRHVGRRRSLLVGAIGAIAMLSGLTAYALDDVGATRTPSPGTPPATLIDRPTVRRPPLPPRPMEAPLPV